LAQSSRALTGVLAIIFCLVPCSTLLDTAFWSGRKPDRRVRLYFGSVLRQRKWITPSSDETH